MAVPVARHRPRINRVHLINAADDTVGRQMIARVFGARRDLDAPLFALLRSSGDPSVVTRLNAQLEEGLTRNLPSESPRTRARIRADMVTALLLGIGVQRVLLRKKPMASARDDDIAAVFLEAFEAITKLPQGAGRERQERDGRDRDSRLSSSSGSSSR